MELDLDSNLDQDSNLNLDSNFASDSVVEELEEEFDLDKIIADCQLAENLCEETVSPNQDEDENHHQSQDEVQDQVAAALEIELNTDQDEIEINPPADPVSVPKRENLPEFIQKMSKVKNFIGALKKPGKKDGDEDEDSTEFIDPTDFSTSTSTSGLWFNIPEPTESMVFYGREKFLGQLHDQLQGSTGIETGTDQESKLLEVTVLSQVKTENLKIVSNLGGIGKTETAKKYLMKYRTSYNNIIWIEADTERSIQNSFLKLAEELEIDVLTTAGGKSRNMSEIVKDIYNKICEREKSKSNSNPNSKAKPKIKPKSKPNLIVFDNAEDFECCQKFLPFGLDPDLKKPMILATSRNQEWISPNGKIQLQNQLQLQVLPLDFLTESESLLFIQKELELWNYPDSEIPEFRGQSKELIKLIGGLPLVLQQALAFIKQEKEVRKSYKMTDYVQEFKSSNNKFKTFLNPPVSSVSPESDSLSTSLVFSPTVFITWNMTFEKLRKLQNGPEAIKILELLSFLYADKIPCSFLQDLVPETDERKFSGALKLLEKYSMIKINNKDFPVSLSIHRHLQLVILQYLKEYRGISRVTTTLLDNCCGLLQAEDILENLPKSSSIFLNAHHIFKNPLEMIPLTETFLDFMDDFGWTLWDAGEYSESLEVFKTVLKLTVDLLGEESERAVESEYQVALNLEKLGKVRESLILFKENLRKKESHPDFGPDHPETIQTKHQIALMLRQEKKYGAALLLFQQIFVQQKKINGDNHPETLVIQDRMALLHSELGNFQKALALYADVEKKQRASLGPTHENAIIAKQNKATVLYKMGKFTLAAKTFQEIHHKQKDILGELHLQTVNTLDWTARALEQSGKFSEALDLYTKVYEIRAGNSTSNSNPNLGVDHPQTVQTKYNMAAMLQQEKRYGEALDLFQQVLVQQTKIYGENHPETFKTQNSIALLHSEQAEYGKALEMLENFEKERQELLGSRHEQVLQTKMNRAVVLYQMDRFQEASKIFHEVYDVRKETLGENHKETGKSLEWIACSLQKQRRLTQAVDNWKEVYEIRKASLDEGDGPTEVELK